MIVLPEICGVDVNVGIAANGQAAVCPACELACVETLQAIMTSGRVAIDSLNQIWDEYMAHLRFAGEPGIGDEFMKWIHEHQWGSGRCEAVPITPRTDDPLDFEEFPNTPALAGFDRSDRKYVAVAKVACTCLGAAEILNATDSDWLHHHAALLAEGVPVTQLCPGELKASAPA